MNTDIITIVLSVVVLTVNCTTMFLTFPSKRGSLFTIGALVLFAAIFFIARYLAGMIVVTHSRGLFGLLYLPLIIWLFDAELFHKVFAFFLQFIFTMLQVNLAETVGSFFASFGQDVSLVVFLATLTLMLATYVFLIFKFGRRIFEKLFVYGHPAEWILYSLGAIFAFAVLTMTQIAPGSPYQVALVLFFILWSFVVLCFAIINVNEKSKQRYEIEFAQNVISSGRDYYQKMNEMYETLRILRHDYRHHLSVISKLFRQGNNVEIEKYLTDIQKALPEIKLEHYCSNTVLNALFTSYSERCAKSDILLDVSISMPTDMTIPNYDMCIVLGNLLENAVEACCQQEGARRIELAINSRGAHLAVMVKNSVTGEIRQEGDMPLSTKQDGGFGLRSVQAIAARYGGELMTEWDDGKFTAYVLMSL